jgi:outer membrane protein assembly factor BamB
MVSTVEDILPDWAVNRSGAVTVRDKSGCTDNTSHLTDAVECVNLVISIVLKPDQQEAAMRRRAGLLFLLHRTPTLIVVALVITLVFSSSVAVADDWPQFRGPTGDGHGGLAELPLEWDEETNVAWKVTVPGRGHSSPVIKGKRLWLTSAHDDGRQLDAFCFDVDSGKIVLRTTVFEDVQTQRVHKTNTHASPTPVIDGKRVFVHFGSYGTACIDAASADILWKRNDLIVDHRHGPGSSPVLADDLLILQFDGLDRQFMIALNAKTGDTAWRRERDIDYNSDNGERKKSFCTPLLIERNGRQQLVTTAARAAISYDPASGNELWRVRFIGDSATSRPVATRDSVILTTSCVDAKMFAIRLDRNGDITDTGVRWRLQKGVPQRPSPLFAEGLLYCIHDHGVLSCRDPETGKVIWQTRLGGNYSASPVYAGGRIYIVSESGKTSVLKPGRTLKMLAQNELETGCVASPAVAHRSLFLRTAKYLYRISPPDR